MPSAATQLSELKQVRFSGHAPRQRSVPLILGSATKRRSHGAGPVRSDAGASANVIYVRTKQFSDAPGLSHAASRTMGSVSIENLGDLTTALAFKIASQSSEPPFCLFSSGLGVVVHPQVGSQKGTQKPRPDGSLVIRAVAAVRVSFVASAVRWIAGRQTAQTIWS